MKNKKFLIFIFLCLMILSPMVSLAQSDWKGLVPCDNSPENPCNLGQFIKLIDNVIQFILRFLALPIAAIMFAYAGFLMVTSGGSSESRNKAKDIFKNTVIGILLVAGCWLIVKTFLTIAGYQDIGRYLEL